MLFAVGELGGLCFLFFFGLFAISMLKIIVQAAKTKELAELKKNNPEAWVRVREIQLEEEKVKQARGQIAGQVLGGAGKVVGHIIRSQLKK